MAEFAASGLTPGVVGKGVGFSILKPVAEKALSLNLRPIITEKRNVVITKVDEKIKQTEKIIGTKPKIF